MVIREFSIIAGPPPRVEIVISTRSGYRLSQFRKPETWLAGTTPLAASSARPPIPMDLSMALAAM
jgi:hypothetical protein